MVLVFQAIGLKPFGTIDGHIAVLLVAPTGMLRRIDPSWEPLFFPHADGLIPNWHPQVTTSIRDIFGRDRH